MSQWGIDISGHQAGADLAKAQAAGCSFVFAKATEGVTWQDATFAGFRAQASKLGLPFGAYHFARPQAGRTGAQEAAAFLGFYRYAPGDLPPVLDLEDTALGNAATVAWALDWLTTVQNATGVRPILYTGAYFATSRLSGGTALAAYDLWLASYTSITPPAPAPWTSWRFWQHTSTATVPGIPGSVDRDITNQSITKPQEEIPMAIGDDILAQLKAFRDEESNRYGVYTGRNGDLVRRLTDLGDEVGGLVDKIAAAVAAKFPAGAAVDVTALAKAVRDEFANRPLS